MRKPLARMLTNSILTRRAKPVSHKHGLSPQEIKEVKAEIEDTTPVLQLDLRQTLTEKEKCIYELLCKNLCNKEIAEIIGLTTDGVVYYLRIIYRKLGVHSANKIAMRQMAISYAGTRVLETVTVKNGKPSYTMTEIYAAMHKLTQYDSQRRQEILEDLFSVLESKKVEC